MTTRDTPEAAPCSNRVMIQPHRVGEHPDVCGVCAGELPTTHDTPEHHLPSPCPKCGHEGFLHSTARYHRASCRDEVAGHHSLGEHLDFICTLCGYRVERPTADTELP
jgi:DNA-directed RNA polymerase subunit RPC12/RpoP